MFPPNAGLATRFKSGAEWTGNPSGKPKGFSRLLRDLMTKSELCGEPVPGGRTVEQALVEAAVSHAIRGNAAILAQIIDRLEGPVRDRVADELNRRVTFEIIPNNRDASPELEQNRDTAQQQVVDVTPPADGGEEGKT